jgi:hypothetical protein
LDLSQVIEEGALFSFSVFCAVDPEIVEEQAHHAVALLRHEADLMRVHAAKVLEGLDELRQESKGDSDGFVAGQILQAALNELEPYEALRVEAEQTGERLLGLGDEALGQLVDAPVLQQIPQKGVARLTRVVQLVMR